MGLVEGGEVIRALVETESIDLMTNSLPPRRHASAPYGVRQLLCLSGGSGGNKRDEFLKSRSSVAPLPMPIRVAPSASAAAGREARCRLSPAPVHAAGRLGSVTPLSVVLPVGRSAGATARREAARSLSPAVAVAAGEGVEVAPLSVALPCGLGAGAAADLNAERRRTRAVVLADGNLFFRWHHREAHFLQAHVCQCDEAKIHGINVQHLTSV